MANFSFASSVTSTTLYSGSISPEKASAIWLGIKILAFQCCKYYQTKIQFQFYQTLPVWYIGISSPSANSRINVPETGELLSSSKVSLRDTRFLAALPVDVALAFGFNKSEAGLNLTEEPEDDEDAALDVVEGVEDIELATGEYKESTDDL